MKTVLVYLFILFPSITNCQSNQNLTDLNNRKVDIERKIQILTDSLLKIKREISLVEATKNSGNVDSGGVNVVCVAGAKFRPNPNPVSDPIYEIQSSKSAKVLDYSEGYFGVLIDSTYGYVNEMWIVYSPALEGFKAEKKLAKQRKQDLEELREKLKVEKLNQEAIESCKKKYGTAIYNRIKNGDYWLGMTEDMAILSLGRPENINRTVGRWGVHEQWSYSVIGRLYLYFENGKLTSFQD